MARPSQKNKNTLPDVQKAIYNSAVTLFAKNGFSATSTKDIADTAKVNKAMIYYYYESKEKLFKSIINDGILLLEDAVRLERDKNTDIKSKLKLFLSRYLENFANQPELSQIIFRESMCGGEIAKDEIINHFSSSFESIAAIIEQYDELKAFDSLFLSRTIWGMASMFIASHIATGKDIEYEKLSEQITELFLHGAIKKEVI